MPIGHEAHLQHISKRFNNELKNLRDHMLVMGGMVEKQVQQALTSLLTVDSELASDVKSNDKEVNKLELIIDEECTNVIALQQPAASDLRLVITVTKMVNDLERIGDEAKKIAKSTLQLSDHGLAPLGLAEVRVIGNHVRKMLNDSLDAFTRFDTVLAYEVIKEDEDVDAEYRSAMRALVTNMMEDARNISSILQIMWVLRSLERVGDHSRNLCQHIIYMVEGRDVRHSSLKETEEVVHHNP